MTHDQLWGLVGAGILHALGWVLLRLSLRRDSRKKREKDFEAWVTRCLQILQDRYGFDFTEHGARGSSTGADDRHSRVLPCLDNSPNDDSLG